MPGYWFIILGGLVCLWMCWGAFEPSGLEEVIQENVSLSPGVLGIKSFE